MDRGQAETRTGIAEPQRRIGAVAAAPASMYGRRTTDAGGVGGRSLARLAGAIGNRGFARVIARMEFGEGILPTGRVHPDVEAAIAAASGRGRPLDSGVAEQAGARLGDSFGDVRVHTDESAAALSRAVAARAFTVGRDIFFGPGEYSPSSSPGRALLTHELAHVSQQRGAPANGPLSVSQPGDAMEREAEAAAGGPD